MAKIEITAEELKPIVQAVVAEVLAGTETMRGDWLAALEADAAEMIGVQAHQLRDARLRGEIVATKIGGRIGYERSELIAYLARNRKTNRQHQ